MPLLKGVQISLETGHIRCKSYLFQKYKIAYKGTKKVKTEQLKIGTFLPLETFFIFRSIIHQDKLAFFLSFFEGGHFSISLSEENHFGTDTKTEYRKKPLEVKKTDFLKWSCK